MADKHQSNTQEYYELLVQNAQKGEPYFMMFRGDPVMYVAIPVISTSFIEGDDHIFSLKVLLPEEHKGTYTHSLEDIELLEKRILN